MSSPAPTPDSVFFQGDNPLGQLTRAAQGIDHIGRGRPEWNEGTGRYQVPKWKRGAGGLEFQGYGALSSEDARWDLPALQAREETAKLNRQKTELRTERDASRAYQAGREDSLQDRQDSRIASQLELSRQQSSLQHEQFMAQLLASIKDNAASRDLQGQAMAIQAYAGLETAQLARDRMGHEIDLARDRLKLEEEQIDHAKTSRILDYATRLMQA